MHALLDSKFDLWIKLKSIDSKDSTFQSIFFSSSNFLNFCHSLRLCMLLPVLLFFARSVTPSMVVRMHNRKCHDWPIIMLGCVFRLLTSLNVKRLFSTVVCYFYLPKRPRWYLCQLKEALLKKAVKKKGKRRAFFTLWFGVFVYSVHFFYSYHIINLLNHTVV